MYVDHENQAIAGFNGTDEENHTHPQYEVVDITGSNVKLWKYENGGAQPVLEEEINSIINSNMINLLKEETRKKRNDLLAECDWTQTVDSPLSSEKKSEWAAYRQSLRDLTLTITSLDSEIVWPTKPSN